jgi:hypothetical protein
VLSANQQLNIMKGQAEAARMQIVDMVRHVRHDSSVMQQCVANAPLFASSP